MPQYAEDYEDIEVSEEFVDVDDDDGEAFGEFAEDEDDDNDDDDGEAFGELEGYEIDVESLAERRRRRGSRRFRPRRRRFRGPQRLRSVGSIRSGSIQTPAGTARVRLPKSVATRASVNARLKEVKQEIARNTKGLKGLQGTLNKNTSLVDGKINTVRSDLRRSNKKMQARLQQAMMMPLLLQSKPKLESASLQAVVGGIPQGGIVDVKVTNSKFASSDSSLLPLMMMMGGMGGGGSSNMMMMALVLSGGFGGGSR